MNSRDFSSTPHLQRHFLGDDLFGGELADIFVAFHLAGAVSSIPSALANCFAIVFTFAFLVWFAVYLIRCPYDNRSYTPWIRLNWCRDRIHAARRGETGDDARRCGLRNPVRDERRNLGLRRGKKNRGFDAHYFIFPAIRSAGRATFRKGRHGLAGCLSCRFAPWAN